MKRLLAAVLLVAASAGIAVADEATARQKFDAGERAYNLGEFPKAVDLFKQAYDQWPEPAFLFNVAQTYRQIGDCKQALFFYKRFLSLKEEDTRKPLRPQLKDEVEKRIGELEECMKRELASKPPQQLDNGGTTPAGTGTPGTPASTTVATSPDASSDRIVDSDGGPDGGKPASTAPTLLSVRALAGATRLSAGNLDTKVQFTAGVLGGYPLAINDKLTLELGAAFGFTPVPYTTLDKMQGRGRLIGLLANVGPSYEVIPKLAVRADIGLGVLLFGGLKDMNPFTEGGGRTSGALTVFHLRTGLSVDYAATPNIVLTATPIAFGYSPAPADFDPSISSLTTLSFMAGLGYRR